MEEDAALRGRLAASQKENQALVQSLQALNAQCSRLEGDCRALAARVAPEAAVADAAPRSPVVSKGGYSSAEHTYGEILETGADISSVVDSGQAAGGATGSKRDSTTDVDMMNAKDAADANDQQGAAYWRVRAARLEQLLDVAARKNLAFEDTVTRLEAQMRAMEREWDAMHSDQTLKVSKRGRSSTSHGTTPISAILSLPSAPTASVATDQQRENSVSTAQSNRSDTLQREVERLRADIVQRKQETARLRSAGRRKSELLAFEKERAAKLQVQLESASSSAQDLEAAQTQCVELRAKVKEQARQLQDVRIAGSVCHEDNVQLSFRLQQTKKELSDANTRIKALETETQRLRSQLSYSVNDSANSGIGVGPSSRSKSAKKLGRFPTDSTEPAGAAEEEAKALRRRVLQKHELVMQCKAKITSLEEELARERASAVKLGRANQQLQQKLKLQLATSTRTVSQMQTEAQTQLRSKQQQLNGLRASVYDVFEAFVCCFEPSTRNVSERNQRRSPMSISNQDSASSDSSSGDKLDRASRWTDFSLDDLETLEVTTISQQRAQVRGMASDDDASCAQLEARVTLRELEKALDRWPEDCRAEICRVVDGMLDQQRRR